MASKATRFLIIPGGRLKRLHGPKDGNEWKRYICDHTGYYNPEELAQVKQTRRQSNHDLLRPFEEIESLTLRPKPKRLCA